MIGDIMKEIYSENLMKELYEIPIVSSCLFRSLDQFSQNFIYRLTTNGGQISRKDLLSEINKNCEKEDAVSRLDGTISNLQKLKIISKEGYDVMYKIDAVFASKLNEFIENPPKYPLDPLPADFKYDEESFNLLNLLTESNEIISSCGLTKLDENNLTKSNFDFIRSPIGYKISILIKGYLKYKKKTGNHKKIIKDILYLCLMKPKQRYKINEKNLQIINELESIKLVKKIPQERFIISDYLHNFAFETNITEKDSLKCRIIIETNFKVYTQVKSHSDSNYKLLKSILKSLLKIEHGEYSFENELIVGEINRQKLIQLFRKNISSSDFFGFFRQYMEEDLSIEKDLGKWNKLKFLGLEGPSEEMSVPNNVKQEVKLWETLHQNGDSAYNLDQIVSDSD